MTYWSLNAVFLALVAAVAIAAAIARRAPRWRAIALSAVIVLIMTAVFDNVLVGLGIVGYDASRISGVFVGVAPLEDFAYAVAALILLPSLWTLLGARSRQARSAQQRPRADHSPQVEQPPLVEPVETKDAAA